MPLCKSRSVYNFGSTRVRARAKARARVRVRTQKVADVKVEILLFSIKAFGISPASLSLLVREKLL